MGVLGDIVFVSHQNDGVALGVEICEQSHDFIAGFRVEISGGLVGENDGGRIHQRPGDGHALALSAGEFIRLVVHAVAEIDAFQGFLGAFQTFFGRVFRCR